LNGGKFLHCVRHRAYGFTLAAAASLLLAGCGDDRVGTGLDCFPEAARPFLASAERPAGFESGARQAGGPVTVYIDASGSMAGYIDGAAEARRPFQDLIATIPDLFPTATSPVTFRAFGSRIREVPRGAQAQLLQRGFYACGGGAQCDNGETRLDLAMSAIEREPDRLAIVVTDMWFADPSSVTTGLVPLARPLENILAGGRTIGVYGVRAPYRGTIFDLPGGQTARFDGDRPLVVLAIGPAERVAQFGEELARSSSSYLAESMQRGTMKQAMFTIDPALPAQREAAPLSGGTDPRIRRAPVLDALERVRVQQFSIARDAALRPPRDPAAPPAWEGPADETFIPNAVWRGPLATRTRVWERRGDTCTAADWPGQPAAYDKGWSEAAAGKRRFALDPGEFVGSFRRPGVYLLTAEVARTALEQPNPATAWMRQWSFSAGQGASAATAGEPGFFRTLHLSEFARLLENSLTEAAQRNPGPITGIAVVVRVTD
jgi:hypothetical protein